MNRRNWLMLSRKLVDRLDMSAEADGIESSIDSYAHDYFGTGVAQTPDYPTGLIVTLSGSAMQCSVSDGVAFDPLGNRMKVVSAPALTIPAAHASLPRKDLIVLRYKKTGTNLIPKPSDPISTVYLNLIDDYDLLYLAGTPNVSPVYPTPLANDVILDGVSVPHSVTLGTSCALDDTVRMFAVPSASRLLRRCVPVATGTPGLYALPFAPCDPLSLVVFKDGLAMDEGTYTSSGSYLTIDLSEVPANAQDLYVVMLVGQTQAMAQSANMVPGGKLRVEALTVSGGAATLSQLPIDPTSVTIYVDGLLRAPDEYGVTGQLISFTGGNAPSADQETQAVYLVGTTAIIPAPGGGGGGGGSSAYVLYGSPGAPISVDPTIGIAVASDDRQMRFIQSPGGAQPVTASPQIASGTTIGQEMVLVGGSNTDYLVLDDGTGLSLNGPWESKINAALVLAWIGSLWIETSRR